MNTQETPQGDAFDSPSAICKSAYAIFDAEIQAVGYCRGLIGTDFVDAVKQLTALKGSLIVSGIGKSGLVGQKVSATSSSCGLPSSFIHSSEAMHGDLGRIRRGDVVLLLSFSGETPEVVMLAGILAARGVSTICMSRDRDSSLGRTCKGVLEIGGVVEACPLGLAPSASTTAMLVLGDALVLTASRCLAYTTQQFANNHPSGSLGLSLCRVRDLIRLSSGSGFGLVQMGVNVREALAKCAASGRRSGSVVIVDDDGAVSGILTDGDIRRLILNQGEAWLDGLIDDVMNRSPVVLGLDATAGEAKLLMEKLRIDEIPVVDDFRRPVGLLDVQDILGFSGPHDGARIAGRVSV